MNKNANLTMSIVESTRQPGREFLRVEDSAAKGPFGVLQIKTGFLPFEKGDAAKAMQAIKEGKAEVVFGSFNQRQSLYNLAIVEAGTTEENVPAPAIEEATLEHKA